MDDTKSSFFDVRVVWNDFLFPQSIKSAKMRGMKTLLYQHGRFCMREYRDRKPMTDGVLVWGEDAKRDLMMGGYPEHRILVAGHKAFDDITYRKKKERKDNIHICFTAQHWAGKPLSQNDTAINTIKDAMLPGDFLTVKTTEKTVGLPHDISTFKTKTEDPKAFDKIKKFLKDIDVVVTLSESTFELFARVMEIPVIQLNSDLYDTPLIDGRMHIPQEKDDYMIWIDPGELKLQLPFIRNVVYNLKDTWKDEILIPSVDDEDIDNFVKTL